MARAKLEITKKELQKIVDDLEKSQTFATTAELYIAIANTSWAKSLQPRPLTAQVARLRVMELGVTCKTKPGKRGRQKGQRPENITRIPRSQKMKAFATSFQEIRKNAPKIDWALKLIDAAEKTGSLRAAIKLKCLDCVCWQPIEIKLCTCTGCSLYPHRPYKQKISEEESQEETQE